MRRGFTLVELIVVVIIVGILAAVATPIIYNMKARAISTEAVMGLSMIRQAIRNYSIEHGEYPYVAPGFLLEGGYETLGINLADLDGTYFHNECYYLYSSGTPSNYYVDCRANGDNSAPQSSETASIVDPVGSNAWFRIKSDGRIQQEHISRSGYPDLGS